MPTFGEFADGYVAEIAVGFSNPKHRAQWSMTLGDANCASIRGKPIDEVSTDHVVIILRPIWLTRSETASRLRGRIEQALSAAKARGLRSGDNPALWRGHLDVLLPKRPKLTRGHHKAKPYAEVPALMERLGKLTGISTFALHGFRSSFRDWCAEETSHPREIAEQALADVVGDATERAYRRGDALEKRRALMAEWSVYCARASLSRGVNFEVIQTIE